MFLGPNKTKKISSKSINNTKEIFKKLVIRFSLVVLVAATLVGAPTAPAKADSISDLLNQNAAYQQQLNNLYKQQNTLQNQIDIAQTQEAAIESQIATTQAKLTDLNSQIDQINGQIKDTEKRVDETKVLLGQYIRQMYINGQTSQVQLILTANSFSDFVDQSQYLSDMQSKVQDTSNTLNQLMKDLQTKKTDLQVKQDQTKTLLSSQSDQQAALLAQTSQKNQLLAAASSSANNLSQQISNNNNQINLLRCIASGACDSVANGNLEVVNETTGPVTYESQRMYGIGGFLYDGYNDLYWEGCLITSLAMVHGLTPRQEAANHSYTDGMMIGDSTSGRSIDWGTANYMLAQGRPVIFHLNIGHFVVAIGMANGKYLIDDPFFDPPKSYDSSQVDSLLAP
jgi:peptidoglycan hydrolase CwlO-like protein